MLKKLGLKHQLHAATVLLTISTLLFISGCAVTGKSGKAFYPEYYAARQLQNNDIVKLRELTVNPDLFVADSATLLLGSYYLYYGDKNYGKLLIDKSYNSKHLNEEMSIFGKLWKMESLLKDGEKGAAINMGTQIKELRRTPVYMRVMQIYCNQLGVLAAEENDINKCIDTALNGQEKFKNKADGKIEDQPLPISTDNMTYEEYLAALGINITDGSGDTVEPSKIENIDIKPDAKIKIAGGDIFSDEAAGIIYGMSKYGNNYQVEPVSDFAADEKSRDSMLLRLNNYDLFIAGNKYNLGVDYLQLSEIANTLDIVKNKKMAVIITSDKYTSHGSIIADSFKSSNKEAFNINISSFQEELKNLLTNKEKKSYIIIIISDEKEALEVLPIAKYWQVNSSIQDVLVMTGFIPEFDINDDQKMYLKGTYILTASNLLKNSDYITASEEYKSLYGMPLSGKGALGYDIITFINNTLKKDITGKYITGIDKISNGYAVRPIYLLYSNGRELIEKKTFYPKEEGNDLLP